MGKLIGSRKWRIIFIKNSPDDEQALKGYITRLEASLSRKPLHYEICRFTEDERKALEKVSSLVYEQGGLEEAITEALINKIIKLNKSPYPRFNRVATVFSRSDFGSDEAFRMAVNDPFFRTDSQFAICWRRGLLSQQGFLSMKKKLSCLSFRCGTCQNEPDICEHSCLPRLLWLLFDEDKRVKDTLQSIVDNDEKISD